MMNLFEGHFLQNKGFDAYSFLRETGVVLFPEENCTVKTGLVVTHSVFKFFFFFKSLSHKLNFADHVCNLLVCLNEVWLMPSFALLK